MASSTMDRLWNDYEGHHHASGNKTCHMIGIPLIIVGLLGLLAFPVFHLGAWPVEAALLPIVVAGAVQISLDARLGAAMFVVTLLLYSGARLLGWEISLGLFLLGWVFQFVGHGVYEKQRPAFYKNLAHLLVGPLWVLNHFIRLRASSAGSTASAGV
jgi:uncharacterized membrane protein YGL010W